MIDLLQGASHRQLARPTSSPFQIPRYLSPQLPHTTDQKKRKRKENSDSDSDTAKMTTQRKPQQPATEDPLTLPRGEYHPASPTDSRAPCPVMNSLANHGLISRTGRNITKPSLEAALAEIGLARVARAALCSLAFKVHADEGDPNAPEGSSRLGFRDVGQVDEHGVDVFNLEQMGRAKGMEHDVSLSRRDRAVGDHMRLDPGMYEALMGVATNPKGKDGKGGAFNLWSLASHRKTLHADSKATNPHLVFGIPQHAAGSLEVAAMQAVFGKGVFAGVPKEYYEAILSEERLPYREGWKPRRFMLMLEIAAYAIFVAILAWPFSLF
ncbi:Chloroperoxidase [Aspergillus carlsbadensis]|nr:Chloroperoxidase [Aspergillus carlsbadensis]